MKKARNLALLAALTAFTVVAVIYTRPTPDESTTFLEGELVPGLSATLDRVARVDVSRGEESAELIRTDGKWVVSGRGGYPADRDKVRELLFGLAHLSKLEAKTRRPEQHSRLGLDAENDPARIILRDEAGEPMLELLVGKDAPGSRGGNTEYFVLVADDPQVWLVEGRLPELGKATDWLSGEIVAIDRQRTSAVQIRHPDGEVVRVERRDPAQTDFGLPGLAEAESVKSVHSLNAIASVFADLRLDDVRPASESGLSEGDVLVAELTTFDGLRLKMHATTTGGPVLAQFFVELDPSLREGTDDASGLKPLESVQEEVATLALRFDGWIFELPDWQLDGLSKRRVDLVNVASGDGAAQ